MNLYIDAESGTVLNGPILRMPEGFIIPEDASDSEVIDLAWAHGEVL